MVQLAALQTKVNPSRQSSTSDDSDDDEPVKKGGNRSFLFERSFVNRIFISSFDSSSKKGSSACTKGLINKWK